MNINTKLIQSVKFVFKKIKFDDVEIASNSPKYLIGKNGCGKTQFVNQLLRIKRFLSDFNVDENSLNIRNKSISLDFCIYFDINFDLEKNTSPYEFIFEFCQGKLTHIFEIFLILKKEEFPNMIEKYKNLLIDNTNLDKTDIIRQLIRELPLKNNTQFHINIDIVNNSLNIKINNCSYNDIKNDTSNKKILIDFMKLIDEKMKTNNNDNYYHIKFIQNEKEENFRLCGYFENCNISWEYKIFINKIIQKISDDLIIITSGEDKIIKFDDYYKIRKHVTKIVELDIMKTKLDKNENDFSEEIKKLYENKQQIETCNNEINNINKSKNINMEAMKKSLNSCIASCYNNFENITELIEDVDISIDDVLKSNHFQNIKNEIKNFFEIK